jgi:hypothetical protein
MDPTHAVKASQVGDAVSFYMRGLYLVPKSTVQAVVDSGGMVSPNWEDTGNILDQSHPAPLSMVASAMSRLDDWGIDHTQVMTFFSTVDFGPTHAEYGPLDHLHQILAQACQDVGLMFGLYGETGYLDHVGQQSWFPPGAGLWCWAGLGTFPGMTMKQEYGHANDPRPWQTIGCDTDSSVVYEPLPVHGKLVGPQPPEVIVPGHVTYGQRADGSYVQIVDRLDGTQGWRHVGEIPGGSGGFYAVHKDGAGVNPVGDNECNAMGHYDNVQDQQWVAAHSGNGTPVDINAVAAAVLNQMAARLGNG